MHRLLVSIFMLALTIGPFAQGIALKLPMKEGSLRFAIIGDTGTGDSHQHDVARQLTASRATFPFGFVLMGTVFVFPLFVQVGLGWTPTMTGNFMIPGALAKSSFASSTVSFLSVSTKMLSLWQLLTGTRTQVGQT